MTVMTTLPHEMPAERPTEPTPHRASERGGFGNRMHYTTGGSSLNSFSLGDVVAYDTEADATVAAAAVFARSEPFHLYTRVTVEPVERGAWSPSIIDALFLDALPYVEAAADRGDAVARRLGNRIRETLPSYAPASVRAPR